MAFAKRISIWGIASLVLMVGERAVWGCSLYQFVHGQTPLLSSANSLELCSVVQLAAAVCGVVAIRRGGSRWWSAVVVPAILLVLFCFFGDL